MENQTFLPQIRDAFESATMCRLFICGFPSKVGSHVDRTIPIFWVAVKELKINYHKDIY